MVAQAYRAAVRAGFGTEFWGLTPHESRVWFEEMGAERQLEGDLLLATAWNVAALSRQKKLPPLEKLLNRGKKGDLSARLKAAFATLPKSE